MTVNLKLLAAQIIGMFVVFAASLFLAAGTVLWPAGWTFLVLFFGFTLALSRWLLKHNPGLLTERMTGIGKPDQKTWDKVFYVGANVIFLAWLVLMRLDAVRFRWSQMFLLLQAVRGLLLLCSFYLFFLTFRGNAYLSLCWRMKTTSRTRTVGTLIPHVARSLARSWRNGYGISGWNWGNRFLEHNFASPNLPQPLRPNRLRKKSLCRKIRPRLQASMVLPNVLAPPLLEAFPAPLLHRNLMAPCIAQPTILSTPRNGVLSAMAPYGSCMRRASIIAVPAPCAPDTGGSPGGKEAGVSRRCSEWLATPNLTPAEPRAHSEAGVDGAEVAIQARFLIE